MATQLEQDLLISLQRLTLHLCNRVVSSDWDVPEEVVVAERFMKVLSSYGRNIEKCLTMTKDQKADDIAPDKHAEIESLREDLIQRLDRYAERTGTNEIRERVRSRGFDPDAVRMDLLGQAKSTAADDR